MGFMLDPGRAGSAQPGGGAEVDVRISRRNLSHDYSMPMSARKRGVNAP